VLELLRRRILSLDKETQRALKTASVLGSPFSLKMLKLIVNKESTIKSVLSTGMIRKYERSDTYYRFVHDKVQEATYSLLPKDPSKLLHYIGQKLCVVLNEEELSENIFIVAKLLYSDIDVVKCERERLYIAELSAKAAEKSMAITAFKDAYKFSTNGIKLLGTCCWSSQYDLSLKLYYLAAKSGKRKSS